MHTKVVSRDPGRRTVVVASVIAFGACSTLACGDDASPSPPVAVGLTLTLDNPENGALGRCDLAASGTIVVGSPPPSEASQGTPTSRGQSGLTEATCTVGRTTSPTQFSLSARIETADLRMSVEGQALQGATTEGATVTVIAPAQERNLLATGCTVSAVPPPFAVDVHTFYGRVQCPTSKQQGFTDIACFIDAILSLSYCGG
jgi:hypothetical protein